MRASHSIFVLAALLFGAALLGQAQTSPKDKDIEQKRASEKFNGKTLFEWSNDLKDKDVSIRVEAMAALKWYGPAARREVPAIFKGMVDPDLSMQINSLITLGFVGVDPKDGDTAIKAIQNLLRHSQMIVRFQAIRTLTQLGQFGIEAVYDATPALIRALVDPNSYEIRSAAATALGYVAWTDKGFDLPAFRNLVIRAERDPVSAVRLSAVLSLILFGKPAALEDQRNEERVLHALTIEKPQTGRTSGRQYSAKVAIWAYVCLMRIDLVSEGHLNSISRFLKKDLQTRIHAARALAVIGPQAGSQVDALIEALQSEQEPTAIFWIITALGNMKDRAEKARAILKNFTVHKEQSVRDAAARAYQDTFEKPRIDDTAPKRKK